MASKKKLDNSVYDKFFSKDEKMFSFRAKTEEVKLWKTYIYASGKKLYEVGTAAMKEYIENHPLNPDQKKIYDLKMKQKGE